MATRYGNGRKIAIQSATGKRCREMRKATGMGQREMARRLGTTDGAISKLEDGSIVPFWLVVAYAYELDCTLDDLCPVDADAYA